MSSKSERQARRAMILEFLGGVCNDCGGSENLHVDHRDYRDKRFTLTGGNLERNWFSVLDEAEKCQLLCEPCHKDKSRREGSNKGKRVDRYVHIGYNELLNNFGE